MQTADAALIEALRDPGRYPHPAGPVTVIETHISWVVLTGHYAYKIKKPVDLGFLDFSTLEKRRRDCLEELRLNRRLAPQLYLDVIAIGGTRHEPVIGAKSGIIEYAVRMVQFNQGERLDHLLAKGLLRAPDIDALATSMATFHRAAAVAPADGIYGTASAVQKPMLENFEQIERCLQDKQERSQLERLRSWSEGAFADLKPIFVQRLALGRVRECHGDAHFANMVRYDGHLLMFDCLEFDPALRWIDVVSELAFSTMDLHIHGRADFGRRFLDRYLQHSGDYAGLSVLRFYQVYRALVRAKVATIRRKQQKPEVRPSFEENDSYGKYAILADAFTKAVPRALLITVGASGSGKTTTTDALLEQLPLIRIRSDVERKRLFGYTSTEQIGQQAARILYSADAGRRTYGQLAQLAREILKAGFPVLVDATFLRAQWRGEFRRLAEELEVPFHILEFHAPLELLRQRVVARRRGGTDASDADLPVLEKQLLEREALTPEEKKSAFSADTSEVGASEAVAQWVLGRLAPKSNRYTYI